MNSPVWTIILAAGESSRFQGIKALTKWNDGTLLSNAMGIANKFSPNKFIVVTGAYDQEMEVPLEDHLKIYNPDWKNGMGTSIACGMRKVLELEPQTEAVLILSVDQPFISQFHLEKLFQKAKENNLCVLSSDGEIDSPPAIIPSSYFKTALSLTGDKGLKKSLDKYDRVINAASLKDIDTQQDLDIIQTSR